MLSLCVWGGGHDGPVYLFPWAALHPHPYSLDKNNRIVATAAITHTHTHTGLAKDANRLGSICCCCWVPGLSVRFSFSRLRIHLVPIVFLVRFSLSLSKTANNVSLLPGPFHWWVSPGGCYFISCCFFLLLSSALTNERETRDESNEMQYRTWDASAYGKLTRLFA